MHQISISAGALLQIPLRELTALPQTPKLNLRGPTSKGREGAEGKRGGEGIKGRGEGARTPSMTNFWLRHCLFLPRTATRKP